MPNWCNNILTIKGPKKYIDDFVKKAYNRGPKYILRDFEIRDEERYKQKCFKENIEYIPLDDQKISLSFNAFITIPDGLDYDVDGEEYERRYWGVRGGTVESVLIKHENDIAEYKFKTRWRPPNVFLTNVSKLYPELIFALSFSEEFPTRGRILIKNEIVLQQICDNPQINTSFANLLNSFDRENDNEYEAYMKVRNYYLTIHNDWVNSYFLGGD